MRFLGLTTLFAAFCNFALTSFVLSRGFRGRVNRVFGLWGFAVTLWNLSVYFLCEVRDDQHALIWAKLLQGAVIWLPIANLHFCLLIAETSIGALLPAAYAFGGLLMLGLLHGHLVVKGVRYIAFKYYAVPGPLYHVFLLFYVVSTLGSMVMLYRKQKQFPPLKRKRVRWLMGALVILIIFGSHDLLPVLGMDKYPGTDWWVLPMGNIAAVFYSIVICYSIVQHQLLGVQVAMGRAAAHMVRLGFIFVFGFSMLLLLALAKGHEFTTFSLVSGFLVLVVSTVVGSILFPRLFGSGPDAWERRILGDRFEYHDQVRGFISSMQWYNDTNLLLADLHELLANTVGVRSYQIILRDETNHAYSLLRSHPENASAVGGSGNGSRQLPELKYDSPIFRFFEASGAEYLALNMLTAVASAAEAEREARALLKNFDAEFCLPLMSEDDPFGLLLLGAKINGEPYTATDISLMVALVRNLTLIVNQFRLKTQVMQAQELELLGRMSRGMAHDLNNLVTPIQTLLQLMNEGISTEHLREDLLPVALRSIETMREYVREALFFSENARPDFRLGRLDALLREAADITATRREPKQINVTIDAPAEVLVEMDKSLIQRMVTNIIANASDASPPHSTIRVELVRLLKTEADRDWLRIRIIDSGEGIRPEDMNRIFTPYFTTKNRGDQTRGFGLGLSICRKVAHLHSGYLNVTSQLRKGTTVQIDLPSRQTKPGAAQQPTTTGTKTPSTAESLMKKAAA